jgi:hypothetical protein
MSGKVICWNLDGGPTTECSQVLDEQRSVKGIGVVKVESLSLFKREMGKILVV